MQYQFKKLITMKISAVFLFSAIVVAVNCYVIDEKYSNIDISKVLENERLVQAHCECLLKNTRCNNDGEQLKKYVPGAISNKCAECTEKQKEAAIVVIKHLRDHHPEKCYDQLVKKFDPKNEHAQDLKELLA